MRTSLLGLVAALAIIFAVSSDSRAEQYLTIYHLDVGQGDATLVISPTGKTLLVDAGDRGKGNSAVLPILQALKITKLDYVVTSHYHADHLGGLDEVMALMTEVPVAAIDRGIFGPKRPPKLITAKGNQTQYGGWVEAAGARRTTASLGNDLIDLGDGVKTVIVASNGCVLNVRDHPDPAHKDENGTSVALVINFGTFDYFVGGDLTGGGRSGNKTTPDLETEVGAVVGNVDMLQVNHHGSDTSSNKTFLESLDPEVAIISIGDGGKNRKFRHPRRAVLERLHDLHKDKSLKRIFMTNRGETDGGLLDKDFEIMTIAKGHVIVHAARTHYVVNGRVFRTDGDLSIAGLLATGTSQECKTDGP